MPVTFSQYTLDYGLNSFSSANKIVLCSQEPISYADANAYLIAEKAFGVGNCFGEISDYSDGRKISSVAITDGDVTEDGTPACWAALDDANSRLLATGTFTGAKALKEGMVFSLESFTINFKGTGGDTTPEFLGSDLKGWFDGADASTITIAGSGVSNWADKSTFGKSIAQSNDAYRPTYANNAIEFLLNSKTMVMSGFSGDWDFIAVTSRITTGSFCTLLRNSNYHHQVLHNPTYLGTYSTQADGFKIADSLVLPVGERHIVYGRIPSTGNASFLIDGGTEYQTNSAAMGSFSVPLELGGADGSAQPWGYLNELIFLPLNLSDAMRMRLEGYLAHKWDLVDLLPDGHPYK